MFNSIVEAARNSPFKSPFTVHCDALNNNENKELVAGRNIAAAATPEGGALLQLYLPNQFFSKIIFFRFL